MSQTEYQQIQDLIGCLDDLEGFEQEFVTSMQSKSQNSSLTEKQSVKLEQIWNKHCQD